LRQTLDYSQIYNFTLNHDYKFKTIIMFKDVWVSKFKKVYVFLFFECFEHMDPFLWNILKMGITKQKHRKSYVWICKDKEVNYVVEILLKCLCNKEFYKWHRTFDYYKMWVQFTSPHSLDQWIHYFSISPCLLKLVNSLKI
jgi:hypothetical protein